MVKRQRTTGRKLQSETWVKNLEHSSRQIDKLRPQIKRWTWQGRPTRKVRRLHALERKMGVLGGQAMTRLERFKARFN